MSAPDLARAACTVECFLNAMRMEDGPERTAIEEKLVRWLTRSGHQEGDCLVWNNTNIDCYSQNKVVDSFAVPMAAKPEKPLWSNGSQLSMIDGAKFMGGGTLAMLGVGGLLLSMSGDAAAEAALRGAISNSSSSNSSSGSGNSNNNNNNNNNNNG